MRRQAIAAKVSLMTDKELRKLNRAELLQLLLEQSRQNDELHAQLQQANAQLSSRQILLDNAGSIAEASMQLNQVFSAAQQAADAYLENIRELSGRQEAVCTKREAESRSKCDQMLAETQQKCQALEEQTRVKCETMTREAEKKSAAVWNEAKLRLDQLLEQKAGLRSLLKTVREASETR